MKIYLSASSIERWLNCTASPKFIADNNLKPPPSKWANQGTNAHQLAADAILSNSRVPVSIMDKQTLYADEYAEYVKGLPYSMRWIEQKLPNFYGMGNGIVDFVRYHRSNLHICDFKSGWTLVRIENNKQLMVYALNVIKQFEWMLSIKEIDIQIHQPPKKYYGIQTFKKQELKEFEKQVNDTVDNIKCESNLEFKPSEKACQWCPARQLNKCKAHVDWALGVK